MSTFREMRGEIQQLLSLLLRAEIAIDTNAVIVNHQARGITRVTWPSRQEEVGKLFRGEFATVENYRHWIEVGSFSAILYDGSILQMTYDFLGRDLCAHRLAFVPCPFDVDEKILIGRSLLDMVTDYQETSVRNKKPFTFVRLRSPLRFDYEATIKAINHPRVHLTFLWSYCRLAVVAPLSPGHFIRFIFRHFYPELWMVHEFLRKWPLRFLDRTITLEEESLLHISFSRDDALRSLK